ncbi:MAG TPA: ester cyclase [Ktedonobacteraceae bacterium]|nr:ester cyclase [Ktedonobacteraceae bacterium]
MQAYTIPQLVDEVRAGKLSRRQFVRRLSALGISAVGISAILAASSSSSAPVSRHSAAVKTQEEPIRHIQLHQQHLQYQIQGNTNALQNDYAEHAVVEDSMYAQPLVGREAIMARKNTILAASSNSSIQVTNRIVQGNQISVEWVASGVHSGDLPGLPTSGRPFSISGVTVVVRENGKIVREALYYDVHELRRQLEQ